MSSGELQEHGSNPGQVVYESLGAPYLLYRHDSSYDGLLRGRDQDINRVKAKKYAGHWKEDFSKLHRLKARFYDSSGRLSLDLNSQEEVATVKETPIYDSECAISYCESSQLGRIRKRIFPGNPVMPLASQDLDQNLHFRAEKKICHMLRPEEIRTAKRFAIERTNASPEYLAPIDLSALTWAMEDGRETRDKRMKTPAKHLSANGKARDFGNCLISFQCICCKKTSCLIHPTGDLLSKVCLSNLYFLNDKLPKKLKHRKTTQEIDVGAAILQIKQCSVWDDQRRSWFAVRTSKFTSVIEIQNVSNRCVYSMKLRHKIDLVTSSPSTSSFRPCDIASYHGYGGSFANPLIAINSISERNEKRTIHLGVTGQCRHTIDNIQNIEQIEYSSHHPMILHAAATSFVRPALVPNFQTMRSSLAHGSALYTIDLRSNQAVFQWSPSNEVFAIEGICSLSGILPDWSHERRLFVASTSASKLWEIDTRMPYKSVVSWSLPGLYGDVGVNTLDNLHGDGTLLHRPEGDYTNKSLRPILSVEKTPLTSVFSIYQEPLVSPRFKTNSFELSQGPGFDDASIVRGTIVPLLDASPKISVCGLASFRAEVSRIITHDQYQDLDYLGHSLMALGVITMTTKGDIYINTLLERSPAIDLLADHTIGLGAASRVLYLPNGNNGNDEETRRNTRKAKRGGFEFHLKLGNSPPVCSSHIFDANIVSRAECVPFFTMNPQYTRGMLTKPLKSEREEKSLAKSCEGARAGSSHDSFSNSDQDSIDSTMLPTGQEDRKNNVVSLASELWVNTNNDLEINQGDVVSHDEEDEKS